jgi:hypothetical protein
MVKMFHSGDIYDCNTYRVWLVNFNQSSHGKFLVFGPKSEAIAAAKRIEKEVFQGKYPYPPVIKELTEKIR